MSFIQKLEDLPNEILHECFKYLNAFHLFQALDGLNCRFSALIRSTNLHLNFDQVTKSMCEEFRRKASEDPSINERVVSIDFSGQQSLVDSYHPLLQYSTEEFPCLEYLSLTGCMYSSPKELSSILSLIPRIRHLHLDADATGWICNLLAYFSDRHLTRSRLARLSGAGTNSNETFRRLESLTITKISCEQVLSILEYSPSLKQLQISYFCSEYFYEWDRPSTGHAKNLEKVIIKERTDLQSLEYLLRLTPNVKHFVLMIRTNERNDKHIFSGRQLEQLISSFLPSLIHFRFTNFIQFDNNHDLGALPLKLREFESEFWQQHPSWKIRYFIGTSALRISSIPCPVTQYQLSSAVRVGSSSSIDLKIIHDRVTDLTIDYSMIDNQSSCSLPFVHCLRLRSDDHSFSRPKQHLFCSKHIEKLKELLPLSKVKELFIEREYKFESPSVLIQLLTEMTEVSKLGMDMEFFRHLSSNNEQFSHLIRDKIKSLASVIFQRYDFDSTVLFDDSYPIEEFCENYPNLEELSTKISHPSHLSTLLRHLPKLSLIDAEIPLINYAYNESIAHTWSSELMPILLKEFQIPHYRVTFHHQPALVRVCIDRSSQ